MKITASYNCKPIKPPAFSIKPYDLAKSHKRKEIIRTMNTLSESHNHLNVLSTNVGETE